MLSIKISYYFILILIYLSLTSTQLIHKLQDKLKKVASSHGIDTTRYDYEEMMLFPNVGFETKDGGWRLNVHGWRFQTSIRNKFLGKSSSAAAQRLARVVASDEQLVYFNDTFQRERLKPFMLQDESNERITIEIGNQNFSTKTDKDGQFRTSYMFKNADVQKLKKNQQIAYKAIGDNDDSWKGTIYLVERKGLAVISDIDDTVKISEVIDKIRLVANTFIHKFRVVPGMPETYRTWKAKHNCTFHYISAMPDQLYTFTKEFFDEERFPEGTYHMSGERDPEIYGSIARMYPKRVRSIFIRAVKGEKGDDERFFTAFKGVPREKWMIFTDSRELPKDLSNPPGPKGKKT
ncbi:unnamed protein product [Didymodactylos carnosus]|uniref:Phosphatidate phosphatase APP1 catalytic domain-containing protein n=1 Tax=Didymodactylos carnosus TaxID=1234261 RepID=A0A813TU96_9BILA|nr:unnamed protein product [Didymodactylos carnosus]CAF0822891.1 unnamed protein product [Didymodactylos carnosus]CAF3600483.1 unnamed protein product [Didymodactylos carnosus]CAF3607231.1 unnamed protein product [Didymodactylos carnosus]